METAINVDVSAATVIQIYHPESSYAIFCFSAKGDLFVNSDWGFFGYTWRSYGSQNSFTHFLAKTNAAEYIVGKLEINYFELTNRRKIPPFRRKNLLVLTELFIERIKAGVETDEQWTKDR